MTPAEVRRLNRQLVAQGERICTSCERRLPLDAEHFQPDARSGYVSYRHECRQCRTATLSARRATRYRTDPAFREQVRRQVAAYRAAHPDKRKRWSREAKRKQRRRQKIIRIAAAIGWKEAHA